MLTSLSPRRPWLEMLATLSPRMRSRQAVRMDMVTCTVRSESLLGNSTSLTSPQSMPARNTAAPTRSPFTSPKRARRV